MVRSSARGTGRKNYTRGMADHYLPSIANVADAVARDDSAFARNYRKGVKTWPIPYFGDVCNAEVLTVGVNPSVGEFNDGRWSEIRNADDCENRLRAYFANPIKPHPWFRVWERSLNLIDASYLPKRREHLAATST